MEQQITEGSVRQFAGEVANQPHAMAGAVIAASAAQAVALGRACLQISLERQGEGLDTAGDRREGRHTVDVKRLDEIQASLLDWCDQDARAIAEFVALREAGSELKGQQLLCDAPATMGRLAGEAALLLQNFRPFVAEQVHDDLEMSITLLTGTARAALLLLDSNLRIWPEPALLQQYEPIIAELVAMIGRLTPAARIR